MRPLQSAFEHLGLPPGWHDGEIVVPNEAGIPNFGALVLGVNDAQGVLQYAGDVGTGFSDKDAVFRGLRADTDTRTIVREKALRMPPAKAASVGAALRSHAASGQLHATNPQRVISKAQLGLPSFLKSSGGKGLHAVVPVRRLHDWGTVKGFSRAVVAHMARTIPQRFVACSGPKNCVGRIFIDTLRNGPGATTVCTRSARARPGLGMSVPVTWGELPSLRGGGHWSVKTVHERLHRGDGPWSGHAKASRGLGSAMSAWIMRLLRHEAALHSLLWYRLSYPSSPTNFDVLVLFTGPAACVA